MNKQCKFQINDITQSHTLNEKHLQSVWNIVYKIHETKLPSSNYKMTNHMVDAANVLNCKGAGCEVFSIIKGHAKRVEYSLIKQLDTGME